MGVVFQSLVVAAFLCIIVTFNRVFSKYLSSPSVQSLDGFRPASVSGLLPTDRPLTSSCPRCGRRGSPLQVRHHLFPVESLWGVRSERILQYYRSRRSGIYAHPICFAQSSWSLAPELWFLWADWSFTVIKQESFLRHHVLLSTTYMIYKLSTDNPSFWENSDSKTAISLGESFCRRYSSCADSAARQENSWFLAVLAAKTRQSSHDCHQLRIQVSRGWQIACSGKIIFRWILCRLILRQMAARLSACFPVNVSVFLFLSVGTIF